MSLLSSTNVKTFHKSIPVDMEIIGVAVATGWNTLENSTDKYIEMNVNNKSLFNRPVPLLHLSKAKEYTNTLAEVKKGDSLEITTINLTSGQVVALGKTKDNNLYCLVFE